MPNRKNITIMVVVDRREQLAEYPMAQHTLQCYSTLHGYPLEVLALSDNDYDQQEWQRKCPQSDLMFQRHCVLAHFLAAHPQVQFVLFLDADMGVVNPSHVIEEFLPSGHNGEEDRDDREFDLIFYERTFNGEIMAGSYIARNSQFSIQFLHFWANYFFHLPNSFHGTDNGAIHAVFMDLFCGGHDCADQRRICSRLWNSSLDYSTLLPFTVCARNVLGSRNVFHSVADGINAKTNKISVPGKVLLHTDFRKYWARDGWLTSNCWSKRDFIFHGWKQSFLDRPTFARWHSPLVISDAQSHPFNNGSCRDPKSASMHWPYKDTFIRAEAEIAEWMDKNVWSQKAEGLALLEQILLQ